MTTFTKNVELFLVSVAAKSDAVMSRCSSDVVFLSLVLITTTEVG